MDAQACAWATDGKAACSAYTTCHNGRKEAYEETEVAVKKEERDRKAEWRGLKRMECLIDAFRDGRVTNSEVDSCKKRSHDTSHLNLRYPKLPKQATCSIPQTYPATPAYKRAEFANLPALARGQAEANECTGVEEVSTKPRAGSPKGCKCQRLSLVG